MGRKSQARIYAEGIADQNKERMVDELRELLAENPEFYRTLSRMVHMSNADATRVLLRMPKTQQKGAIEWLIPLARIGMSVATFAMEDKYSGEDGGA